MIEHQNLSHKNKNLPRFVSLVFLQCMKSFRNEKVLCSLATSQTHSLAVFLEFGDELIALANNILVLLVLIVGSVCLDDAVP